MKETPTRKRKEGEKVQEKRLWKSIRKTKKGRYPWREGGKGSTRAEEKEKKRRN